MLFIILAVAFVAKFFESHGHVLLDVYILIISSPLWYFAGRRIYRLVFPERYARRHVQQQVKWYRYHGHYRLLKDKYLFDTYAQPTKVPEVIISRYGLFLIEYCDAKYEIFGADCTNRWYSFHNDVYHPFRNPHHQMARLKREVAVWYDIPASAVYTVVIFVKPVTFNHKALKRTGRPERILEILDNYTTCQISTEKLESLYKEILSSPQDITSEPKRCIIETELIEPVTP